MKDPSSWSNAALSNYQRARSSDVTIYKPDGTTRTLSKWARPKRRRRHRKGTTEGLRSSSPE